MDLHRREWAAKVKLIHAIARSQGALSRILDSVADVAAQDTPNKVLAKKLVGNIQVLTKYQNALCRMATGKSFIRRYKKGTPTKPLHVAAYTKVPIVTRGVQEGNKNDNKNKIQKNRTKTQSQTVAQSQKTRSSAAKKT